MRQQLVLLEPDDREPFLDERTREIGRRGLREAREALRRAAAAPGPPQAA